MSRAPDAPPSQEELIARLEALKDKTEALRERARAHARPSRIAAIAVALKLSPTPAHLKPGTRSWEAQMTLPALQAVIAARRAERGGVTDPARRGRLDRELAFLTDQRDELERVAASNDSAPGVTGVARVEIALRVSLLFGPPLLVAIAVYLATRSVLFAILALVGALIAAIAVALKLSPTPALGACRR
jgi:hypothetical protein